MIDNAELEQYKLYVEMTDKFESRRHQTNGFFITLLSALLAFLTFLTDRNIMSGDSRLPFLLTAILGLGLCVIWFLYIRSYRVLNQSKYVVITDMENNLTYQCYTKEWEAIRERTLRSAYVKFTWLEQGIPITIGILYLLLFLFSIGVIN